MISYRKIIWADCEVIQKLVSGQEWTLAPNGTGWDEYEQWLAGGNVPTIDDRR